MKIHQYGKWTEVLTWSNDFTPHNVYWYKGHLSWKTVRSMFDIDITIDMDHHINGTNIMRSVDIDQ